MMNMALSDLLVVLDSEILIEVYDVNNLIYSGRVIDFDSALLRKFGGLGINDMELRGNWLYLYADDYV